MEVEFGAHGEHVLAVGGGIGGHLCFVNGDASDLAALVVRAEQVARGAARCGLRHAKHIPGIGKLALRQIEKMPPCPVLDLHDPGVGIEFQLFRKARFHRRFRH